jgi:hypothetical protein
VPERWSAVVRALGNSQAGLVVGTNIAIGHRLLNAVALVSDARLLNISSKQQIVRLAERDLSAGSSPVWETRFGKIGVAICFDSVFGRHIRERVRHGAQVLLVPTDDAAFGLSLVTAMHGAQTRLRAAEAQRSLVIASNSGPSMIVGPGGTLLERASYQSRRVLTAEVPLTDEIPPALRGWRHVLPLVASGLLIFALASSRRRCWPAGPIGRTPRPWQSWLSSIAVRSFCLASAACCALLGERLALAQRSGWELADAVAEVRKRMQGIPATEGLGPPFRQSSDHSCGAAALAFALTRLGQTTTEADLSGKCVSGNGTNFAEMADCATRVGFSAAAFETTWDELLVPTQGVRILHMRHGHFLTLLQAKRDEAIIFDPAVGRLFTVQRWQIEPAWSGRYLDVGFDSSRVARLSGTGPEEEPAWRVLVANLRALLD